MMRELGMSDLSFLLTGEEGQWAQSNCAEPPVKVLRGDVAVYDGVVEEENKVSVEVIFLLYIISELNCPLH